MDEANQREIEKQQIREEILRSEVARRRISLEAEVRRELMMEEELPLSLHRHSQLGFDSTMRPNDSEGFEITPFHREAVLETGKEKQKLILLEKNAAGSKRKASTPPPPPEVDATELPKDVIISSKKVKETSWRCDICEISTTSEQGLQDHLTGRKHKSKESRLTTSHKTGENYTIGLLPKKPTKPGPAVETSKVQQKNDDVWCDVCDVRVTCEKNMEIHKKGKKHVMRVLGMSEKEKNMVKAVNHEDGKGVTTIDEALELDEQDHKAVDEESVNETQGAKVEDEVDK